MSPTPRNPATGRAVTEGHRGARQAERMSGRGLHSDSAAESLFKTSRCHVRARSEGGQTAGPWAEGTHGSGPLPTPSWVQPLTDGPFSLAAPTERAQGVGVARELTLKRTETALPRVIL